MLLSAIVYASALILFYPYQQAFGSLLLLVTLLYFVSYAMGYFIGIYFPAAKASLIGTGFALLWALVLSGVTPSLKNVSKDFAYQNVSWLWDLSAPRWSIEAFWVKEVEARMNGRVAVTPHTYNFDNCE
jgi:hypothetical protein